jgi:putative hydrolase of the HAD superfamily
VSDPPAAVLFDALGTLVRLEPPGPRLRDSLAMRAGLLVGDDLADAAMRAEMRHYAANCVRAHDDATLAALRLECADVVADALGAGLTGPELLPCLTDAVAFSLYGDVVPALDRLADAGVRLAVVSNWDVSLPRTLERLHIAGRFEAIVHSAEVGASKPDPRPFALALARLALTAGDVVHVGDDEVNDRQGAAAAGIAALVIDRGGGGDLRSLAELPARLGLGVT